MLCALCTLHIMNKRNTTGLKKAHGTKATEKKLSNSNPRIIPQKFLILKQLNNVRTEFITLKNYKEHDNKILISILRMN